MTDFDHVRLTCPTHGPVGAIVVRTTVKTTRGPADWTDLDQSALVALAVGSPLHRRI